MRVIEEKEKKGELRERQRGNEKQREETKDMKWQGEKC